MHAMTRVGKEARVVGETALALHLHCLKAESYGSSPR